MSKYDDKYTAAGEEAERSHVRGIINQLNEEKPSKEKSREVVVRPDGTKVVRVTKKRRVLVSEAEKRRAGRRSFLMILLGCFLVCFAFVAVLLFRMSVMAGESYVQQQVETLCHAWGAERVSLVGGGVDGADFHLSSVVAEFPEGSMVQRVELTDIACELDIATFFTQTLIADKLTIARAEIRLNPECSAMHMPLQQGEALWKIRRVECADFNLSVGPDGARVAQVNNAPAYMYYPRQNDRTSCAVIFSGGMLQIRGMQNIRMSSAKFYLAPNGLEEFSVSGTTDRSSDSAGQLRSSLSIAGRLTEGESFAGPFEFDSNNMPFSRFTQERMESLFSAYTVQQAVGGEHSRATILLPVQGSEPVFGGEFALRDISLSGLPVQHMITEHIESSKRKSYLPPRISRGHVVLTCDKGDMQLELPDAQVEERDLISLRGQLKLNADNELSGKLDIGIPSVLTHAEYADGKADPLFREETGTAWVSVALSGTANLPNDDSARLNAEAEKIRTSRPGRMQLDAIDFDKVANQLRRERETLQSVESTSPSAPQPDDSYTPLPSPSSLPTTRGLDMSSPLDDNGSIFD